MLPFDPNGRGFSDFTVIDFCKAVVRQILRLILQFHGSESDFKGGSAHLKGQLLLSWEEAPGKTVGTTCMWNISEIPANIGTYVVCGLSPPTVEKTCGTFEGTD
jgi:hypothetical protein